MRLMDRNKRDMWLSKPERVELADDEGFGTGEYVDKWSYPESFRANYSTATGDSAMSPFGAQLSYDIAVVLDDNSLGISEGNLIWIGSQPEVADDGQPVMTGAYEVKKVAYSLSSVALALTWREGA